MIGTIKAAKACCTTCLSGLLLLATPPLQASELYLGIDAGITSLEVEDNQFRPTAAGLTLGWRGEQRLGSVLMVSQGLEDDSTSNATLEQQMLARAYATYSFVSEVRSAALEIGLGYSLLQVDTEILQSGFPGEQDYDGPGLLIRAHEHFTAKNPFALSLTYEHLYLDDRLSVNVFNLGVLYAF